MLYFGALYVNWFESNYKVILINSNYYYIEVFFNFFFNLQNEINVIFTDLCTYIFIAFTTIVICSYLRRKIDLLEVYTDENLKNFYDEFIFDNDSLLDSMNILNNLDLYFMYFMLLYIYLQYSYYVPTFSKLAIKDLIYVAMFVWKEVEKEFFSADDVLFLLSVVLCAFGWFFFLSLSIIFVNLSFFNFIITIIPVLILITLLTPIFILYDIGMFSSSYLRGSSNSSLIIFEFIYDCIAIFIMYIRIIIQNLRFIFIFISCIELNEFAFGIGTNLNFWVFNEEIFSISIYDHSWAPYFYNKYFLIKLPTYIVACCYYVLHMLFIVVSNVSAYLFLVFWLYLFLYTCFFTQKFENYIKKKY